MKTKQRIHYNVIKKKNKRFPQEIPFVALEEHKLHAQNKFSLSLWIITESDATEIILGLPLRLSLSSCWCVVSVREPRISEGGMALRHETGIAQVSCASIQRKREHPVLNGLNQTSSPPWGRQQSYTCLRGTTVGERNTIWDCVLGGCDFSCWVMNPTGKGIALWVDSHQAHSDRYMDTYSHSQS